MKLESIDGSQLVPFLSPILLRHKHLPYVKLSVATTAVVLSIYTLLFTPFAFPLQPYPRN